jgi:hypothetical protein
MIDLIAHSIRNHFILDPKRADKLMSDDNYEDSSLLSVIIFVGLCHQHAIPEEEVKVYLGMEDAEYLGKISKFMNMSDRALKRANEGTLRKRSDIYYRFYSKYMMCSRFITNNATRTRGKKLYVWRNLLAND